MIAVMAKTSDLYLANTKSGFKEVATHITGYSVLSSVTSKVKVQDSDTASTVPSSNTSPSATSSTTVLPTEYKFSSNPSKTLNNLTAGTSGTSTGVPVIATAQYTKASLSTEPETVTVCVEESPTERVPTKATGSSTAANSTATVVTDTVSPAATRAALTSSNKAVISAYNSSTSLVLSSSIGFG